MRYPNGKSYLYEEAPLLRLKCGAVALAALAYLPFYLVWHTARTVCSTLRSLSDFWDIPGAKMGIRTLKTCGEGVWTVARAPFFALALFFAGCYGVIAPLRGRCWVGAVEAAWRSSPKHLQWNWDGECRSLVSQLTDPDLSQPLYLARCMQPIYEGNAVISSSLVKEIPY
jgi:hypothetical protein